MSKVHRYEFSIVFEDYDDTRMGLSHEDDWFWSEGVEDDLLFEGWEVDDPIFYDFEEDDFDFDLSRY